ncbi:hypothetical protein Glove_350g106 [Diversispora epigaea]|uniref:BTB domain-containing protein n=1 Tax=Diversispora epigaea TaxID=1348612 RepID=A0A397HH83_9GLOM|nr:hypothetical protein Glove_350g106 [Diversispora epigaea]
MTTKFFDRLSDDLIRFFESGINYDASIEVGEDTDIYKVHSIVLRLRSPYFKKKFDEITFNDDFVKVLKLPKISVKVFNVIIKYVYGGIISLEKLENSVIFELLIASNELELDELINHLQTHLVYNNASWLRLNFAQVYQTSYQVKNFVIIQEFYNDIIAKHPNTIFESENFYSLPEDALISILKRDDLQLDEGKIWDYAIQWGKAKNPTLPANLDEWTSDNFLILKKTLKRCLPCVRFFSIPGKDVVEKIYPYQQLLENQLFLDINSKIIAPNRTITTSLVLPPRKVLITILPTRRNTPIPLSSKIITNEHALEISSWIDKKESAYIGNNPYDFKLLVRGSRDGFDVKTIFDICDQISNTVIILKVKDTGEILGGFNPLEWNRETNQLKKTEDSFIFSLKTSFWSNSVLSRVNENSERAICSYRRDFKFGFDHALCLRGNLKTEKKCVCKFSTLYLQPIRPFKFLAPKYTTPEDRCLFSVDEYEIFEILSNSI